MGAAYPSSQAPPAQSETTFMPKCQEAGLWAGHKCR